jgi:hypothetical protein
LPRSGGAFTVKSAEIDYIVSKSIYFARPERHLPSPWIVRPGGVSTLTT